MTGIEYEQWCAARLRKKGFRNVRMTKASGDQGIDLIAGRNGLTYGFQCKYYSSPIGNDAVQEAYAGKTYYGLDKAAVITNQTFTASAAALAEQTGVELYELETPVSDDHGDLILRIPALILFLSSLYCFAEAVMNAESQGAHLSILFFALVSSGCTLSFARRMGALILSSLTAVIFLISTCFYMQEHQLFRACFLLFLLLMLIRITVMKKQKEIRDYTEEKDELLEAIEESRMKLAKEIASVIGDTLGREVIVKAVRKKKNGSLRIECAADGKIKDDLAIAVYTFNQTADYEKADLKIAAQAVNERNFILTLSPKHNRTEMR